VKPNPITLSNDPSLQAPPLRSFAARSRSCAVAYIRAAFRYLLEPSRPGPASGPSLCSPSSAPGVHCPSQVCSRNGWRIISDQAGPTCLFVQWRVPINFRRVGFAAANRKMRAELAANRACDWIGFWALTPACGPCLPALDSTMPAKTPGDRSCPGLFLLQGCGHGSVATVDVHSDGLDTVRIIGLEAAGA
jgi:hypothetical protein